MKPDIDTAWQAILAAAGKAGSNSGDAPAFEGVPRDGANIDPAAADMLEYLSPLVNAPGAFAIGQIGQSLDGRICTETGDSHYVNGAAALDHLHRLRALVDCVLVGVGTVVADQPRLTVRRVAGPNPVRAVLDPGGRAPADFSPLAAQDGAPKTLHLIRASRMASMPEPAEHVHRLALPDSEIDPDSGIDVKPRDVLAVLASAGCRRVLVEGGADTLSRFVAAGAMDRLHVLVAPLLIGSGRPGLMLPAIARLSDAIRPSVRRYPLDEDTLFDLSL